MKCDCCVRWKRTSSLFNSVLRVACQPRAREGHFKQLVLPVSNIITIFICLNNGQQKLLKLLLGGFSALAAKEIITEIIAEAITSETQESSPNNQTSLWNFYLLSAATFFSRFYYQTFFFSFLYISVLVLLVWTTSGSAIEEKQSFLLLSPWYLCIPSPPSIYLEQAHLCPRAEIFLKHIWPLKDFIKYNKCSQTSTACACLSKKSKLVEYQTEPGRIKELIRPLRVLTGNIKWKDS